MKRFILYVFATMTGIMLLLGFLFLMAMLMGTVFSKSGEVVIKPNGILHAKFSSEIKEQGKENPLEDIDLPLPMGQQSSSLGLDDLLDAFDKAKTDDRIKGIYLDLMGVPAGWAKTNTIRDAILDFKESGKFVVSYAEMMTQKAYYLASAADEVYLNPSGGMTLNGFGGEIMFLKGMLDKLEIEPEILYVGKFKSATEPYRLTQMSQENKEQVKEYLTDIYENFLAEVAPSRGMDESTLHNIINELKVRLPEDAKTNNIVDDLVYESQVFDMLREKTGMDEDDKLNFVPLKTYIKSGVEDKKFSKNKVAVVYAEGSIVDGPGTEENIGSERYAKILRKIQADDNVKAVVMRVNSGGGSALASDVIWDEINQIKEKGIPVIASMSDYAASGGYFIACNSDEIFAEENTLTGSIGVFGILADMDKFYENKLGITFDTVSVTKYGNFPMSPLLTNDLDDDERAIVQNMINQIYDQFLDRVADGRGMTKEAVNEIAQGRVWTGKAALENGLVDKIGGLSDAIASAAGKAGVEEYRVSEYPRQKDPLQEFLNKLSGVQDEEVMARQILRKKLGRHFSYLEQVEQMMEMHPIQMRMPFFLETE